ncbi:MULTISPECIES: hypothetical protein [Weeksellaceae]|jgi:hypothetical protein|uniref:Uncharacterized protein n=2 Tax=Chryseobacterium TaxID=59732 RepID=A0AAD0YYX9_CHRID|nr:MULTISPECIES: hypothetical protein [Weeksellaceae]ATL44114.1 hypothetical protein CQS02_12820 [Elizabethkingia miricola]ASE60504.1 hypothetical protein CEQ15_02750 [Chryseobacterium indologenes]AZB19611.1 hypothetical protein EG352_18470 [Chryseobacterium indologenes]MBE9394101.1 hypothetical protein [Elizabethkingia anophelis]MBE9408499.1 hypothetical protein [Elizabethkingia anophelis]
MIKEFEFYHGVVFSKLIHNIPDGISIKLYSSPSNASYVINDNIGIYIKHSTKRMSPWRFSFQKIHQDEILQMQQQLRNIFVLLVCGKDGVVTLSFKELKTILNNMHSETEWISASRTRNKEYSIKGSDGSLEKKIGKKDFLKKILEAIKQNEEF